MKCLERLKRNSTVRLFSQTYHGFNADNGNLLSAAVAFNLLFSLFPFALVLIAAAGFILESPEFEQSVVNLMGGILPMARNIVLSTLRDMVNARVGTGIIALLFMIWSATSFFAAVRESLDRAWGVRKDLSFFKGEAMNIAMMIGAFILLTLYIWISTGLSILQLKDSHLGFLPLVNGTCPSEAAITIVSFLLAFLIILILYRFVPAARPRWRDIWLGALIAAVAFDIVRYLFIWYIENFDEYNLVYGSLGAVFALLAFSYVSAWIILFCAKLSAVKALSKP